MEETNSLATTMTTSLLPSTTMDSSKCWRAARPCPLTESMAAQKLTCRAWFRCEMAGDYVIKWRCHSKDESEANITSSSLFLCSNQSEARLIPECPPPVVCADEPFHAGSQVSKNTLSTDVVLAIAVATFAFVAMLLIIASTYKYWSLRKRLRMRLQPRQYILRDFPYPVRYHSLWGTAQPHPYDYDTGKKIGNPCPFGSPYPDVYFSRPQDTSKYFERLLNSSEESIDHLRDYSKSLSPGRIHPITGKQKPDPSVATGSFVFQTPVMMAGGQAFKERGWVRQKKQSKKENDSDRSLECYHIYRGNLSKFRTHEQQHYASANCGNYRSEYHHLINASTAPRVSSIAIPSFDFNPEAEQHHHPKSHVDYDKADHHQTREAKAEQVLAHGAHYDSDVSHDSVSHYALGLVVQSSNTKHYNSNIVHTNGDDDHHQQYAVPIKSKSSSTPTHSPQSRGNVNSPDVISSHNFSNKFVQVGKNTYKPLHTEIASTSSITVSTNNNQDLTYDSFRDEHLRELAKRGAASSSTLEAGYRQKGQSKSSASNHRY